MIYQGSNTGNSSTFCCGYCDGWKKMHFVDIGNLNWSERSNRIITWTFVDKNRQDSIKANHQFRTK